MAGESHTTTNHQTIQQWMETRGGCPASVKQTGKKQDPGILRVDFPGQGEDEALEHISWEDFFQKFEESKLAFVYQEEVKGNGKSRFCKFVKR